MARAIRFSPLLVGIAMLLAVGIGHSTAQEMVVAYGNDLLSVDPRIVFTTTYGRTEALSPANGKVLWRFTPPAYASLAGTARITNSSPAASTWPGGRARGPSSRARSGN